MSRSRRHLLAPGRVVTTSSGCAQHAGEAICTSRSAAGHRGSRAAPVRVLQELLQRPVEHEPRHMMPVLAARTHREYAQVPDPTASRGGHLAGACFDVASMPRSRAPRTPDVASRHRPSATGGQATARFTGPRTSRRRLPRCDGQHTVSGPPRCRRVSPLQRARAMTRRAPRSMATMTISTACTPSRCSSRPRTSRSICERNGHAAMVRATSTRTSLGVDAMSRTMPRHDVSRARGRQPLRARAQLGLGTAMPSVAGSSGCPQLRGQVEAVRRMDPCYRPSKRIGGVRHRAPLAVTCRSSHSPGGVEQARRSGSGPGARSNMRSIVTTLATSSASAEARPGHPDRLRGTKVAECSPRKR